jgi:hypothetical protein
MIQRSWIPPLLVGLKGRRYPPGGPAAEIAVSMLGICVANGAAPAICGLVDRLECMPMMWVRAAAAGGRVGLA